jgi:hypothetical protein
MENGITEVRDKTIIAAEINTIKERTKREVLTACVEIGQRLYEAKEIVQHGDWEQWLHDSVDYSQSTADNLMRIYKEYGDEQINLFGKSKSQTFKNLTYSQAIALFALPAEEREEFVEENNVEDMSTRKLQEMIKAKQEADAAKTAAENKLNGTEKLLDKAKIDKDNLEQALKKSDEVKAEAEKKAADEIKKLKEEIEKIGKIEPAPPSAEELEKMRAKVKAEVEAEYKAKEQQLTLEKKSSEEKAAEKEKEYQEKLKKLKLDNKSILKRQQEAEKKLSLNSPEAQKFNIYFKTFQQNFEEIQASLKNISNSGNAELAKKLKSALLKVIEIMANEVKK